MGLAKKSMTETLPTGTQDFRQAAAPDVTKAQVESGATAAIARLKTKPAAAEKPAYKQYDPTSVNDEKSRRILRQGVYQHVSISPSVAGMKWEGTDQFVTLVSEIAEKLIKRIEG